MQILGLTRNRNIIESGLTCSHKMVAWEPYGTKSKKRLTFDA